MTRNHQVNLRLTFPERRAIHHAAKRAGLPASEWVRLAALAAAGRCPMCGVGNDSRIPGSQTPIDMVGADETATDSDE